MSKNNYTTPNDKNKLENPEIQAGIALLRHKRDEFSFNHPQPYKPQLIGKNLSRLNSTMVEFSNPKPINSHQEYITIYPLILLSTIQSKQDIVTRLWFICKHIDKENSGWIYKKELLDYLQAHQVENRKISRWIMATIDAGLIVANKHNMQPCYRILGLVRACERLNIEIVGKRVEIPVKSLLRRQWHANVFAGYLATRKPNPISQETLSVITGIATRTQNKYQHIAPVIKKRNYVKTGLDKSNLTMMKENRQSSFIGYQNKIYFRIPDSINVPESMARRLPKCSKVKDSRKFHGRFLHKSSNYPNHLNSSNHPQEKTEIKLFHQNMKSAQSAMRKIDKLDLLPWNKPQEIFIQGKVRENCNIWLMLPVG
jgi:hypothetical protein